MARAIIHLTAAQPNFNYTNPGPKTQRPMFASASARAYVLGVPPVMSVFQTPPGNSEQEVDTVALWAAHSWWAATNQPFCDDVRPGGAVRISLIANIAAVDIRVDFTEID